MKRIDADTDSDSDLCREGCLNCLVKRFPKEMAMRIGSAAALTALLLATAAPFLPACSDPVTHRYVVGVSGMH